MFDKYWQIQYNYQWSKKIMQSLWGAAGGGFQQSSKYKSWWQWDVTQKIGEKSPRGFIRWRQHVFGRPYYRSSLWYSVSSVVRLSVCNVLYCGKMVRPSKKLSEGVNRKPGSKSSFLGSPPYFYFRFRRYGHQDGRFCLIFARIVQQSVLDGRNWLSSSKPCAYCRIVWSELKPDSGLFVFIT